MCDNFPLRVRDQRYLLLPAWQNWLLEGNLAWFTLDAVAQRGAQRMNFWSPTGSNIGLTSGSELRSYRTAPNHL